MNRKHTLLLIIISLLMISLTSCSRGSKETAEADKSPEVETAAAETSAEEPPAAVEEEPSYPPAGWVIDIREAYKIAQAEDKRILINFTGSDWCVWCKKLSAEVFSTDEFRAYAETNLVLLYLDFPNGIELPAEQVSHNQLIMQILGVQGYPSIWLFDKDLNPLMATGYQEGGPGNYIRHLEEDRPEIAEEERENFRLGFTIAIEDMLGPLK